MALDLKKIVFTRFARSRQLLPLQQGKPLLGKKLMKIIFYCNLFLFDFLDP
jgi:hypothetical protein